MSRSRPSSILLQPYRPSSSPASSASSIAPKRIKFAPLPELPAHHTDKPASEASDPVEDLSSSSSSSSSQLSSSTTSTLIIAAQCDLDKSSPDSSIVSSPIIRLSTLPAKNPVVPTHNTATTNPESLSWAKNPHKSLLRHLKRFSTSSSDSSSHTLTPTPSIESHPRKGSISAEEILTLGAINLFRTASRESGDNESSPTIGWGIGLSRWTNLTTSNNSSPRGSPLARTQSTQSYKSKSSSSFPTSSSSCSSLSSDSKTKIKPTPLAQQPRANRHTGTRMLNGRVYGGPKRNPNANPFANARDEEPEFVEWGYGGMGSVKGAKSAGVSSDWGKLHGGSGVGVGGVGAGIGATGADLDDGSGLAWVKRRREEKERKTREQETKEAEKASESQMNTSMPTTLETIQSVSGVPTLSLPPSAVDTPPTINISPLPIVTEDEVGETATQYDFPTPTPTRYPSELGVSSLPEEGANAITHENERVLQAITIPVRVLRHHHHRPSSKGGDKEVLLSLSTDVAAPSPISVSPSTGGGVMNTISPLRTSTITPVEINKSSSFSSIASDSESESDGGTDNEEEEDEDEDEESQKQDGRRKTGTAAGVEKISRHKE